MSKVRKVPYESHLLLDDEETSRDDIVEIELKLKSYFLDEPLENIVKLATDIYYVFTDDQRHILLTKMLKK